MAEQEGGRRPLSITVKCQYDGYGFDITAELTTAQIPALIERLREVGVEPANSPYTWQGQPQDRTNGAGDSVDVPKCRIHGRPMKESKNGGWYCPAKLADGSYCEEKA